MVTTNGYLTFVLAGEEYGINILSVQEIRGWSEVRSLPNTPDYLVGVMDLRGEIVPIVDMRLRFNLPELPRSPTSVVIILRHQDPDNDNNLVLGLIVDAVSDVYELSDSQVKPAPNFGARIDTRFIRGIASIDSKLLLLIDLAKLMDMELLHELAALTQTEDTEEG